MEIYKNVSKAYIGCLLSRFFCEDRDKAYWQALVELLIESEDDIRNLEKAFVDKIIYNITLDYLPPNFGELTPSEQKVTLTSAKAAVTWRLREQLENVKDKFKELIAKIDNVDKDNDFISLIKICKQNFGSNYEEAIKELEEICDGLRELENGDKESRFALKGINIILEGSLHKSKLNSEFLLLGARLFSINMKSFSPELKEKLKPVKKVLLDLSTYAAIDLKCNELEEKERESLRKRMEAAKTVIPERSKGPNTEPLPIFWSNREM